MEEWQTVGQLIKQTQWAIQNKTGRDQSWTSAVKEDGSCNYRRRGRAHVLLLRTVWLQRESQHDPINSKTNSQSLSSKHLWCVLWKWFTSVGTIVSLRLPFQQQTVMMTIRHQSQDSKGFIWRRLLRCLEEGRSRVRPDFTLPPQLGHLLLKPEF